MSPFVTVRACDHNSHEYIRARPRRTRDVNFKISNYLIAVEFLIASEASFYTMRQALASTVHAAAVGAASPTQIFPASDSEHRPRHGGVRLAYKDPSGE